MTRFGVHENRPKTETLARFPKTLSTREFTSGIILPQPLVGKLTAAATSTWEAGLECYWSVKLSVYEVVDDSWKPHVEELAAYLRDNPQNKTVVVLWHEPESAFSAVSYVGYFNKIRGWLKEVHPGVQTCHAANSYFYREGGPIDHPEGWLTEADLNAIDIYSGNSFPLDTILPEQSSFTRWLDLVSAGRSPWAVTERGWFAEPFEYAARANTIRREAEWLAIDSVGKACYSYTYWNTSGQQKDFRLVLDTLGEDAIRTLSERIYVPPKVKRDVTVTCPLCLGDGDYTFTFEE